VGGAFRLFPLYAWGKIQKASGRARSRQQNLRDPKDKMISRANKLGGRRGGGTLLCWGFPTFTTSPGSRFTCSANPDPKKEVTRVERTNVGSSKED